MGQSKRESTIEYLSKRYKSIIPNFESFLSAIKTKPKALLRKNSIKIPDNNFKELFDHYSEFNLSFEAKRNDINENYELENVGEFQFSIGGSLEHVLGFFYVQGLSSQIAVEILEPQLNESILDLCAAPGGKSILIAEKMHNTGMIIANEPYSNRSIALKSNLDRMGVINTIVTKYDGRLFPKEHLFDRVLLDGPCSSEGTLNLEDHLDSPFQNDFSYRQEIARTQRALILKAFDVLKVGGTLVYSTCTYAPEENEVIVQFLLENRTNAKILDIDLDYELEVGLPRWKDQIFHPDLKMTKRIYPHQIASWGFYVSKITKI